MEGRGGGGAKGGKGRDERGEAEWGWRLTDRQTDHVGLTCQ